MKLKNGFIIREVVGQTVVLPSGNDLDLNMMITLNGTGKFLWELLENECSEDSLVNALMEAYDVDEATARSSVVTFVQKLNDYGFLV